MPGMQELLFPGRILEKWKISYYDQAWIHNGGGFIGIGEPTAYQHEGHFFQLAVALGVDKERGFSLSTDKYFVTPVKEHFISADSSRFDFGEGMKIFMPYQRTQKSLSIPMEKSIFPAIRLEKGERFILQDFL